MTGAVLGQWDFVQRLLIATLLGAFIGFERQWRQRTAGLHTSTIVAVGAALFTSLPGLLGDTADPLRVAAQVISGVGFLAGGVILRDGFNVRGLITAATLWATAAVGTLAGTGFELQAALGAFTIVAVNFAFMPLASVISSIPRGAGDHLISTYTLRIRCDESARSAARDRILQEIRATSLTLSTMSSSAPHDGIIDIVVEMTKPGRDDGAVDRLENAITALPGVLAASWDVAERQT